MFALLVLLSCALAVSASPKVHQTSHHLTDFQVGKLQGTVVGTKVQHTVRKSSTMQRNGFKVIFGQVVAIVRAPDEPLLAQNHTLLSYNLTVYQDESGCRDFNYEVTAGPLRIHGSGRVCPGPDWWLTTTPCYEVFSRSVGCEYIRLYPGNEEHCESGEQGIFKGYVCAVVRNNCLVFYGEGCGLFICKKFTEQAFCWT